MFGCSGATVIWVFVCDVYSHNRDHFDVFVPLNSNDVAVLDVVVVDDVDTVGFAD